MGKPLENEGTLLDACECHNTCACKCNPGETSPNYKHQLLSVCVYQSCCCTHQQNVNSNQFFWWCQVRWGVTCDMVYLDHCSSPPSTKALLTTLSGSTSTRNFSNSTSSKCPSSVWPIALVTFPQINPPKMQSSRSKYFPTKSDSVLCVMHLLC